MKTGAAWDSAAHRTVYPPLSGVCFPLTSDSSIGLNHQSVIHQTPCIFVEKAVSMNVHFVTLTCAFMHIVRAFFIFNIFLCPRSPP